MIVIVTLEYLIIDAAVQRTHIASRTNATFFDWYIGLPAVVVGCEMPLCAALMHWAFPVSDHIAVVQSAAPVGDPATIDDYSNVSQKRLG